MRTLTVPITADGPLVEVHIELAAANAQILRQAGQPVPAGFAGQALIDTGSEVTCIDPVVLGPLVAAAGLQPARFVLANVPLAGGVSLAAEYFVSLSILHPSGHPRANLMLRNHAVVEQTLGPIGLHVLVGRDVLDLCLHVYDGPGKSFTFAY
jgi:hypothetical protein